MNKVRWGIVSAGRIANTFARDAAYADNAEVVAVAARSGESAARFAEAHGIERSYQGYDRLFGDPGVDAVYIATPHTCHLEHAIDALAAGKAVLCEKPVTTSAGEFEEMAAAANRAERFLMEAMWTWFLPAVIRAKEWVDAGRIGELRHVQADFGYPLPYHERAREYDADLAGGCLLEMGIYPVAFARLITDSSPSAMHVISRFAPNGVEDDVAMLFDYDDCVAMLATSFRCKLPNLAFIVGTEGHIVIPDFWRAEECHLYALDERVDSFRDAREGSGFEFQIGAASADILNGRTESGVVTHAASLAFQQDMERVKATF